MSYARPSQSNIGRLTITLVDLKEFRKVRIQDKLHGYLAIHPDDVNMVEAGYGKETILKENQCGSECSDNTVCW